MDNLQYAPDEYRYSWWDMGTTYVLHGKVVGLDVGTTIAQALSNRFGADVNLHLISDQSVQPILLTIISPSR